MAINVPGVSDLFDYHIPPDLSGRISRGCLVEAPFGKQQVQGVVTDLPRTPEVTRTKALTSLLDEEPVLTDAQLSLAFWLAEKYFNPLPATVTAMLPPGLSQTADSLYSLRLPDDLDLLSLTDLQRRIIKRIQEKGPQRGRQMDVAFRRVDWRKSANALIRKELLTRRGVLPEPTVRGKTVRQAVLNIPRKEIPAAMENAGRIGSNAHERRGRALKTIAASDSPAPQGSSLLRPVGGG